MNFSRLRLYLPHICGFHRSHTVPLLDKPYRNSMSSIVNHQVLLEKEIRPFTNMDKGIWGNVQKKVAVDKLLGRVTEISQSV